MGTAVASAALAGLTRAAEGGYQGPPELTVARAFTEWTLDPWMLALVLILGGGYVAAVRRQPGWPVARRQAGRRRGDRRGGAGRGKTLVGG